MIKQVTWYDFSDWFLKSDSHKDNFSFEGLIALYDYLEELDESMGEQTEFDPIAICCDYSEYDSLKDIKANYPDIKSLEDLQDNTTVIECDNGHLIIQDF
jgi:hypothetical protein